MKLTGIDSNYERRRKDYLGTVDIRTNQVTWFCAIKFHYACLLFKIAKGYIFIPETYILRKSDSFVTIA